MDINGWNWLEWLKMAKTSWNGRNLYEMARNGWKLLGKKLEWLSGNGWIWLEIAVNCWKQLEMAGNGENGWKWPEYVEIVKLKKNVKNL